eukprot:7963416-Alexandrium_andersonii.AAC.1
MPGQAWAVDASRYVQEHRCKWTRCVATGKVVDCASGGRRRGVSRTKQVWHIEDHRHHPPD